jgi:hypothetical protein
MADVMTFAPWTGGGRADQLSLDKTRQQANDTLQVLLVSIPRPETAELIRKLMAARQAQPSALLH